MKRDASPGKATWLKKAWQSKRAGPLVISPIRGSTASRARDRAKSRNATKHEGISVFNLAEVQRHLEEQVVLTTCVHNVANVSCMLKEEFDLENLPIKDFGSSFGESSSRISNETQGVSKSPKWSPKSNFFTESEEVLKRKSTELVVEYKRRINLSDWRYEKTAFVNKKVVVPTSQQIVLPIQSPATSRRANMKILSGETLHFSRRKVDDNDQPLMIRATTAPGPSETTSQKMKIPSTSKRDASVGVIRYISTIKSANNLANRGQTTERGKQLIFQSTKFSSPRETNSKDGLHSKHVYVHGEKNLKNGAMDSQNARESPLGLEGIELEPQTNLKLKLKNIVARLRPEILKAESQACHRQSFLRLNFVSKD